MKTILLALLIAASALAQSPVAQINRGLSKGVNLQPPKRPLGVPADAKHFNGRWYRVYLEKKSWHAARDKCKELGGQLVTVPDAATWEFVKTLMTGGKMWLGATDEVVEGKWQWVDGSPVTFTAWADTEPNNFGASEHYIASGAKPWNDLPKQPSINNSVVVGFICEWGSSGK